MNITYQIPDAQVQRVYDALKVAYGDIRQGETTQVYARRVTCEVLRDRIVMIETSEANKRNQEIIPPDLT